MSFNDCWLGGWSWVGTGWDRSLPSCLNSTLLTFQTHLVLRVVAVLMSPWKPNCYQGRWDLGSKWCWKPQSVSLRGGHCGSPHYVFPSSRAICPAFSSVYIYFPFPFCRGGNWGTARVSLQVDRMPTSACSSAAPPPFWTPMRVTRRNGFLFLNRFTGSTLRNFVVCLKLLFFFYQSGRNLVNLYYFHMAWGQSAPISIL